MMRLAARDHPGQGRRRPRSRGGHRGHPGEVPTAKEFDARQARARCRSRTGAAQPGRRPWRSRGRGHEAGNGPRVLSGAATQGGAATAAAQLAKALGLCRSSRSCPPIERDRGAADHRPRSRRIPRSSRGRASPSGCGGPRAWTPSRRRPEYVRGRGDDSGTGVIHGDRPTRQGQLRGAAARSASCAWTGSTSRSTTSSPWCGSYLRLISGCLCDLVNPPCPTCTELRVPLARVRIEDCEVTDVCSLVRQWVLAPRTLDYWLPIVEVARDLLLAALLRRRGLRSSGQAARPRTRAEILLEAGRSMPWRWSARRATPRCSATCCA